MFSPLNRQFLPDARRFSASIWLDLVGFTLISVGRWCPAAQIKILWFDLVRFSLFYYDSQQQVAA
jgi:hypothetical protein